MKADSVADLRRIFHGVVSTVGALEGIDRPISDGTDLFVHLVVELLDAKTRREWENSLGRSSEPPSYEALREFLQEQLMTQEVLRAVTGEASGKSSEKSSRSARANHAKSRGADSSRSCPLCKKEHFLAFCEQYKKKSAQERREAVNTHQRCWNCLGRHMVGECASNKTCNKCSGRHHTTLHEAFTTATVISLPAAGSSSSPTVHVAKRPPVECASVLLATARVLVMDRSGARHSVRALVDPGSETSLIAESLAQRLRLPRTPTSVTIFGVGGVQAGFSRGRVALTISARSGQFALAVSSLVLPRLSVYSGRAEGEAGSWPHVQGLELADPEFLSQDPIELLLGAEVYASIVLSDLRRGGPLEPIAQNTRLGWILLGAVGAGHAASVVTSSQCIPVEDLAAVVRRFWEWEEPPSIAMPLSASEQECEDHFLRTHSRLADGRYQVRLPIRAELPDLSFTRRAAARMLEVMAKRFERDVDFRDKYSVFMENYLARGHMSRVPENLSASSGPVCYLPHHGVLKGDGTDAKIRVVFNGSSRTAVCTSLNDALHTGPNLLPVLADVVMRWRRHRFVFVADVEKMYRQVMVHPEDRDLQRILWRKTEGNEFRLNTVTYGLACAPYLAIRVLRQLANDEESRFPLGAEALRRDIYMDDVLTGAASLERSTGVPPTKRTILSQTARLFDPLGWLAPIVIRAKLVIQAAWLQRLEWDAPLAVEEAATWTTLEEELPLVEQIRIPRWFRGDPGSLVKIYGFSDASEQAYAAVVYLRVIEGGLPHISLVMAKTRVAPLKRVSLPRLELCAASLLAKLASHVCSTLSLETSPVFLWTDSTVALSWIRGHPAKWTTFVANRVAEIQRLNRDAKWRHVPGR
ncbi:gag-pol polyprotein precursor, partial [Lasius niger]